ncbi:dihydrofolate reductase family protein [Alteribacter lacisalsi]|nr:dihydrofolate reductase family protein [Alteribacter lacisalsi]
MAGEAAVFLAVSLDGCIATRDDGVDWLNNVRGEGDNGYGAFYSTVDTVVMGRRTYDWMMEETDGEYPYEGKPGYVISEDRRRPTEHVSFTKSPVNLIQQLKRDGRRIWIVGGSLLIHSLLEAEEVDELILTMAPVILGDGIPLFYKSRVAQSFSLKSTRRYGDFVELHYLKEA